MVKATLETNSENDPLDFTSGWFVGGHCRNRHRIHWTEFEIESPFLKHSFDHRINCCHFYFHQHDLWHLSTLVNEIEKIRKTCLFQAHTQSYWNDCFCIG